MVKEVDQGSWLMKLVVSWIIMGVLVFAQICKLKMLQI